MKNEVRLGNWVQYDGKHFQLAAISEEYPFLNTVEFGHGVVEWKDLQPIPLTGEILLKCGAIDLTGIFLIKLSAIEKIGYNIDNGRFWLEGPRGFLVIKSIDNLHQLQNLYFALTGQELEFTI